MNYISYTLNSNVSIFPQFILHQYFVQVREPNQKKYKIFKITNKYKE